MKRRTAIRALQGIVGALILAGVFLAYLRPSFVLDLANRIVMCF